MVNVIEFHNQKLKDNITAFLIIAVVIFVFTLIGILGRPLSFLAIFWPANAILLGLFLRFPLFKNMGGWVGAFTGFMLPDLLNGNTFLVTLFLTLANLSLTAVTLALINILKLDYKQYNKGLTFLYLFMISAFGGCLTAATFACLTVPHLPNTFMSMDRIWIDFGMWWTGEILNVIAFLPIVLAIPEKETALSYYQELQQKPFQYKELFPFLGVVVSVILTHFFIGPGAIMFPIAALVWAALSYNLFFVSIINCVVCMLLYNALTSYYIEQSPNAYLATTLSVRIGLFMLALAPLTLAIISFNRQKLYHQILYLANHDGLTTTLNRRYFYEESEKTLTDDFEKKHHIQSVTILVLDLDHFKKINDQYGHVIGDYVLQEFTKQVKTQIRTDDLFGRLGGEEFAILFKNLNLEQSIQIAQRICNTVFTTPIHLDDSRTLNISVSIGLTYQTLPYCVPFQQLIKRADDALYLAKEKGRNQLCLDTDIQGHRKFLTQ